MELHFIHTDSTNMYKKEVGINIYLIPDVGVPISRFHKKSR